MYETVIHLFWERVSDNPDRTAILFKRDGQYHALAWREYGQIVERAGAALLSLGLANQTKIAIMSASRVQWTCADLANLSVGGVTVPVYPSLTGAELEYLVHHSDAAGIFVENSRQLRKLACSPSLGGLTFAVVLDGEFSEKPDGLNVMTWDQFLQLGQEYLQSHPGAVRERAKELKGSDLATIVYTSGTTGVPKGAMIPHSNILFVCRTLAANVGFHPEDISLSFLPLSHIFERIGGQFLHIHEGIVMAFAESMEAVAENMMEVRPTIMNAVPRFYEKVYNRIQVQIRGMPAPQQYLIRWAIAIGRRALKAQEADRDGHGKNGIGSRIYRTELRVADRIVFSKIRQRFGGRLRFLISGAAPLSQEVHQFFEILGLPIIEGYGLTETTAPVACNKPGQSVRGTVGRAVPGVDIKIAPDGEILVRGPNVFAGYYKNEEATREAFRDGWFLTGDIGDIDEQGYLRIKDRKKDIIITAGGKHIAPQVIENMLAGQGLISRIVVYGDRRKHVVALITPNLDEVKSFAETNGLSQLAIEELVKHSMIVSQVQTLVDTANARLASFEQIKRFLVLPHDFTIEANELTPTLKIRRKYVSDKYRELLDSLYNVEDLAVEKGLVS